MALRTTEATGLAVQHLVLGRCRHWCGGDSRTGDLVGATVKRKRDRELTATRKFKDKRSYVDVYGKDHLFGEDMSERRLEAYERDKGRCQLIVSPRCRGWASWEYGELDHVITRGRGGSDNLENLRWVCNSCHWYRHNHPRINP